jgi:acetoin utilization deacetylase AcuC-like enzyme
MKTAFYSHRDFGLHKSTSPHPERPERLEFVEKYLRESKVWDRLDHRAFAPATDAELEACHSRAMIARARRAAEGGFDLDGDTYTSKDSMRVALLAAGAAMQAARDIAGGQATQGFVATRPPGHHATDTVSMGFCLFNMVALAAAEAGKTFDRVAILDWDVHHGNGTQDIFYSSPNVLFASLHEWPLYPGTGSADERGEGAGLGLTRNIPLRAGQGNAEYLRTWRSLEADLAAFEPKMILVSAGFDAHADDPLGHMEVTEQGFADMTRQAKAWAARWCEGRLLLVLEGGYNLDALGRSATQVLEALLEA